MTTHDYVEPQIIVIEGLDGVGKTTLTKALVELTGGADITEVTTKSMGLSRRTIVESDSVNARLHYWLAVNYLAGEYATKCVQAERSAIIDSYFFRTIVSHETLGASLDWNAVLSTAVRPDRAILLTIPEDVRTTRLVARDDSKSEPLWHAELDARWIEVLGAYRQFKLMEVDASDKPQNIAKLVLESSAAQEFRFPD